MNIADFIARRVRVPSGGVARTVTLLADARTPYGTRSDQDAERWRRYYREHREAILRKKRGFYRRNRKRLLDYQRRYARTRRPARAG